MSNDLISRSALIQSIKKWLSSDPCGKEQSVEEVVATDLSVSMLMEIEEAPTAYDVDAVCEEIKNEQDKILQKWRAADKSDYGVLSYLDGKGDAFKESIDIVRNGGI